MKFIILAGILFVSYRLFFAKQNELGSSEVVDNIDESDEYSDYEELD